LFQAGTQSTVVIVVVVEWFDQSLPSGSLDLTHKSKSAEPQF